MLCRWRVHGIGWVLRCVRAYHPRLPASNRHEGALRWPSRQLDDPACFGVLVRSVALALLAYVLLLAGQRLGHPRPARQRALAGLAGGLLGTIGVLLLAFWLFLPTVMVIATLYIERIARAVDRRHYPSSHRPARPPSRPSYGRAWRWRSRSCC